MTKRRITKTLPTAHGIWFSDAKDLGENLIQITPNGAKCRKMGWYGVLWSL